MDIHQREIPKIKHLIEKDPELQKFTEEIKRRYGMFISILDMINENEGGIEKFSRGYEKLGFHVNKDNSVRVQVWAPAAHAVFLTGHFNNWTELSHSFKKYEYSKWEVVIPATDDGLCPIPHLTPVKIVIQKSSGELLKRLCPWAKYVSSSGEGISHKHLFYNPPKQKPRPPAYFPYLDDSYSSFIIQKHYKFSHPRPPVPDSLKIYECHIGITTNKQKIGTYKYFTYSVLPRIKKQGYNSIMLLSIMEHVDYNSIGSQVTSFFAPSSRYGSPEDLKELVDIAHSLDLYVFLDVVHSHAANNISDGLSHFDGTDSCYFHPQSNETHGQSRHFNYKHWEVLRYLLSNIRWYYEEYHIDGFRFFGVSQMLYKTQDNVHGSRSIYDCFGGGIDEDAVIYLMLANHLMHQIGNNVVTIAQDDSDLPALCCSLDEGGLGFDFYMSSKIPSHWSMLLTCVRDEQWPMGELINTLCQRKSTGDKIITAAETHQQVLLKGKTLAYLLLNKNLYTNTMKVNSTTNDVDRGIALHKMIRLITHAAGGNGHLNFMGNEFGHPGFGDSIVNTQCQWNLVDDSSLKYKCLNNFDAAINRTEEIYKWLNFPSARVTLIHEQDKVIVFERGNCVFIFNFHPVSNFTDYKIGVPMPGSWNVVLSTEQEEFGGSSHNISGNSNWKKNLHTTGQPWNNRPNSIFISLKNRVGIILSLWSKEEKPYFYKHPQGPPGVSLSLL